MVKREPITGKFVRVIQEFSLENFNDGYIDSDGRFRVFYPKSPRAYGDGWALRSLVAWELYHGRPVPKGYNIHHKNKNRLDDSKENLELIKHGEHTRLHCSKPKATCICEVCREKFLIDGWRLKDKSRGKYCSQGCYHKAVKSEETKRKAVESRKWYRFPPETIKKMSDARRRYWEEKRSSV